MFMIITGRVRSSRSDSVTRVESARGLAIAAVDDVCLMRSCDPCDFNVLVMRVRARGRCRAKVEGKGDEGKKTLSHSSSPGAIILRRDPGDSQYWIVVRPLSSCIKSEGCMLDGH